jgi:hypothetical protein
MPSSWWNLQGGDNGGDIFVSASAQKELLSLECIKIISTYA